MAQSKVPALFSLEAVRRRLKSGQLLSIPILINGIQSTALVDCAAVISAIKPEEAIRCGLTTKPWCENVLLAADYTYNITAATETVTVAVPNFKHKTGFETAKVFNKAFSDAC